MPELQTAELHYMPVRIVRPTGVRMGVPSDPDLARINDLFAAEPLTADDIFAFDAIASSDAYDSYYTRMSPATTLPNYVADLTEGAALLDSHDDRKLPFGSSFRADLQPVDSGMLEGIPAMVQVFAGYYMLRNHIVNGVSTEDYRKGIVGGTHRKMSIGFYGPDMRYVCDIDGKDLYESDFYPGQKLSDGRVVTYTIEDAHAAETSIVFKNGSPGALIQRVQSLVDQRHIPAKEIHRLESAWGVRFAGKPQQHFMSTGEISMDEKQIRTVVDGILNRAGKKLSAATREKLNSAAKSAEELIATLTSLLEEAEDQAEEGRSIRSMLGGQATVDGIRTLQAQAKAGETYTRRMIDETVAAKTAVMGDAFTKEKADAYRQRLERMAGSDFDFITDEHENWTAQRKATFSGGRKVPAVNPNTDTGKSNEFLDYDEEA